MSLLSFNDHTREYVGKDNLAVSLNTCRARYLLVKLQPMRQEISIYHAFLPRVTRVFFKTINSVICTVHNSFNSNDKNWLHLRLGTIIFQLSWICSYVKQTFEFCMSSQTLPFVHTLLLNLLKSFLMDSLNQDQNFHSIWWIWTLFSFNSPDLR